MTGWTFLYITHDFWGVCDGPSFRLLSIKSKAYLAVGAYLSPKAYLAGQAYLSQSGCVWVGGPDLIYLKSLFLSISKWGMGGVTPVLLFRAG